MEQKIGYQKIKFILELIEMHNINLRCIKSKFTLKKLKEKYKKDHNLYDKYLKQRAELLGLPINSNKDIIIIKLCNLLKIYTTHEAKIVKNNFECQPLQVTKIIEREMVIEEINTQSNLLYCLPVVFYNALNFFKRKNYKSPIEQTLNILLPIMSIIYGKIIAKKNSDKNKSTCVIYLNQLEKLSKSPTKLLNYSYTIITLGNDYVLKCTKLENIKVKNSIEDLSILKENSLLVALGGGSDCLQATMLGKYILNNCKNIISVRTAKTILGTKRNVTNIKKQIGNGVFLCGENTKLGGRFFENLPCQIGMNCYLILVDDYQNLFEQIKCVIDYISNEINITNIIGVDTGGDLIYPNNKSILNQESTPDQDRMVMETLLRFENLGYKIYTSIIAVGIDSPNGITSKILNKANAKVYTLKDEEKINILSQYKEWNIDGSDKNKFGKTALIWQSALNQNQGLITVNIPLDNVLSKNNPWISTIRITEIMQKIILMNGLECIKAINKME